METALWLIAVLIGVTAYALGKIVVSLDGIKNALRRRDGE